MIRLAGSIHEYLDAKGKKKYFYVLELGRDENNKRKQKKKKGFKTVREAREALSLAESELIQGTYIEPSKTSLSEYLREWLNERRLNVQENTYKTTVYHVENYIIPYIGKYKLEDLNPMILQKYSNTSISERGLAPATVRKNLNMLNVALNKAVKMKILKSNPLNNIDKPKVPQFKSNVWNIEQINTFLQKSKLSKYYIGFLLALSTGMRKSEITNLQWDDIDFENGIIHVKKGKTKSSVRSIHIPNTIVEDLFWHKERQQEEKQKNGDNWNPNNLVMCTLLGNPVDHPSFTKGFKRAVKSAGLPLIRIHDLRHSHATVLISKNVHPKLISERLGHSRIGVTLDIYSHVLPSMQKEVADVLDNILDIEYK